MWALTLPQTDLRAQVNRDIGQLRSSPRTLPAMSFVLLSHGEPNAWTLLAKSLILLAVLAVFSEPVSTLENRELTGISNFFDPWVPNSTPNSVATTAACSRFPCFQEQGIAGSAIREAQFGKQATC